MFTFNITGLAHGQMRELLQELHSLKGLIMATNAELQASLTAIADQLDKAAGELTAEIQKLEDELAAAGGTTPEVDAVVARLKAKVQALDDMNPDAPAPATP
jgi:hypothetical protein